MKLVDYTGKINSHDEYLEILKKLEKKSQYIEYVLVDETDTKFIEKFTSLIVSMTSKNKIEAMAKKYEVSSNNKSIDKIKEDI